jgi:hypothetical protein
MDERDMPSFHVPQLLSWIGGVEVGPIQFLGRETRIQDPHFRTFEALVAVLVKARFLDRSFAFSGAARPHCGIRDSHLLAGHDLPVPRRLARDDHELAKDCP